jgi:multidrug efflux pump subunit AcrA (membrane-fusion protein)
VPDPDTTWQVRVLEAPPEHVRDFLTETEHRFLADNAQRVFRPENGDHGARTENKIRAVWTENGDRAAAGTVGIEARREPRPRRHISRAQRIGGLLLMAACVGTAVWYVPRVVAADQRSLTGTVSSTGVIALNFAKSGQLNKINVHIGQQVAKGDTLATESDPATQAVVNADKAAITADNAKLAELRTQPGASQQADIAVANAQLQKDQAQLQTDQASLTGTRIVAQQPGTVVAVNGQPGEQVTALGIRDYTSVSGSAPAGMTPQFSLLPEGPQSRIKATSSQSELPVVALRISDSWEVVVLVPESSVSKVRAGRAVTINVPAAGISGVAGRVQEVLPTPQSTASGVAYQAVVKVFGHQDTAPLSGMSADVELNS